MTSDGKIYFHGNKSIFEQYKIAFLCSISCPAHIVLKSYDWAIAQREKGNCILSGFHSEIERDVFHFLLKGKQPFILVLARGLKKKYDKEIEPEFGLRKEEYENYKTFHSQLDASLSSRV